MRRHWHSIKAALLQIHSIAGLALSLVLAVIALTGAIMSFEDDIQAGLNAGLTHIAARETVRLSPDALIARLQASGNAGAVSALTTAHDPTATVRLRFARAGDGARAASVYVDPYDGHVLGEPAGETFFATVRRLHRWLLVPGDGNGYGRQITGIAAIGLLVMLLSGLVLRWPARATSLRMWLKPGLGLRGRGLHRSLHAVVGTWVLPVYVVMTLTGLWYSFDWYKSTAVWLLAPPSTVASARPAKAPRTARAAEPDVSRADAPPGLDRAWTSFVQAQGGAFAVAQLTVPVGTSTVVRIRSWPDDTGDGVRDEFRIDAVTGAVLSSERYADKSSGERILARVLDIHRGSILGWPGRLLFMLAALAMPLFIVTGLLLYLSRRRHLHTMRRASAP